MEESGWRREAERDAVRSAANIVVLWRTEGEQQQQFKFKMILVDLAARRAVPLIRADKTLIRFSNSHKQMPSFQDTNDVDKDYKDGTLNHGGPASTSEGSCGSGR